MLCDCCDFYMMMRSDYGLQMGHIGILKCLWSSSNASALIHVFATVSEEKSHALSHSCFPLWKTGN